MPDPHRLRALAENRYWSELEAREALDLADASGLELAEFARRHGFTLDRLKRWRRRLGCSTAKLVRVEVRQPTEPAGAESVLTVVLTNGIRVEVPSHVTREQLRVVLEIAGAC
ncbi:hypothetical protein ENSA5_19080 [Enhygromyxa salina]|uniref:Transposase n=1 Tax=Enhygromyxa salina TaxID=215803 RepID=A0A2S9YCY7_9BACT|nr:hypothetical protein [Enhygromyxa salina]PRQ02969.1 hypothetical protein ENSA5_19080 [Enhygromyxa salina]